MGLRVGAMPDGAAATPGLPFAADPDTGIFRPAGDMLSLASAGSEGVRLDSTQFNVFRAISNIGTASNVGRFRLLGSSGGVWEVTSVSAAVTLNTGSTTTDTASIIPANCVVLALGYRVTTTITTAASYSIGDATTATRFVTGATGLTLGSTGVGLNHLQGGISTDAAGPVFTAASVVRITTNANPGAGVIRVQVWYAFATAPTS